MLRAAGCFGLGILFLAISPALRTSLMEDFTGLQQSMEQNSPGSYIALGVAVLIGVMFAIRHAAQPR